MTKELKQLIEDKAWEMWPVEMVSRMFADSLDVNEKDRDTFIQGAEFMAGAMWVSVDDRLPEIDKRVITFAERGDAGRMEVVFWTDSEERFYQMNGITHWQYAPWKPIKTF